VLGPAEPTSVRAHSGLAPREITVQNELTKECLWGGRAPPNGSRLSCGRRASWRKAVERQTKRLAGESTEFFPTGERPAASSAC